VETIGETSGETIDVAGLVVHRACVPHPLLGTAHVIEHAGRPLTAMSAIDWDRPTRIPTVAEPRALPPGTGSALLNEIARRAQAAGVQTLRYAGPYPTHGLFKSLLRSFATDADEEDFTADLLGRAMRLAGDEVPVDFTPAPFARRATEHGFVDVRSSMVERAHVDGVLYDVDGSIGSLARLEEVGGGYRARLGFGTAFPWVTIAELDREGSVGGGVQPIPPLSDDIVGKQFPDELRAQFAETVPELVAAPLARDARDIVIARPIAWQDLGWRSAARTADGFALHAAMWTVVAPRSAMHFVLTVSHHLAMIVQSTILDEVAARLAPAR
jgi:hypothetical protein